jgi:hypothetical protein
VAHALKKIRNGGDEPLAVARRPHARAAALVKRSR